jgi:hypothetical protein
MSLSRHKKAAAQNVGPPTQFNSTIVSFTPGFSPAPRTRLHGRKPFETGFDAFAKETVETVLGYPMAFHRAEARCE